MNSCLKIIHSSNYKFSEEVFIEPHYFRFKPKTTPFNKLIDFDFNIFPMPKGSVEQTDAENNLIQFCWFENMHTDFIINSEATIELSENNPFNFILFPNYYNNHPFQYSSRLKAILNSYLISAELSQSLIEYGDKILSKSNHNTLEFVNNLNINIHSEFAMESRFEGEPYEPNFTFNNKRGACRDISWMMINLLRHNGIASRFVSGYYFKGSEDLNHDLHGWLEVYLPGVGWLAFDPSNGIAADQNHIPVCTSAFYQNTMPVTGTYRGNAISFLTTSLAIEKVSVKSHFPFEN